MQSNDFSARALAIALAAVIVGGAVVALGHTSNANFRAAVAAGEQRCDVAPAQVAFEPSRIDVVGVRATPGRPRRRTVAPAELTVTVRPLPSPAGTPGCTR